MKSSGQSSDTSVASRFASFFKSKRIEESAAAGSSHFARWLNSSFPAVKPSTLGNHHLSTFCTASEKAETFWIHFHLQGFGDVQFSWRCDGDTFFPATLWCRFFLDIPYHRHRCDCFGSTIGSDGFAMVCQFWGLIFCLKTHILRQSWIRDKLCVN